MEAMKRPSSAVVGKTTTLPTRRLAVARGGRKRVVKVPPSAAKVSEVESEERDVVEDVLV